ncbi:hypothetical protein CLAIMM_10119 isoform 2 [Cladophialophora immunda]|nr:hypothetical protein CLAIMM_10119 isoform 2 [Cladophialophora immunda]
MAPGISKPQTANIPHPLANNPRQPALETALPERKRAFEMISPLLENYLNLNCSEATFGASRLPSLPAQSPRRAGLVRKCMAPFFCVRDLIIRYGHPRGLQSQDLFNHDSGMAGSRTLLDPWRHIFT